MKVGSGGGGGGVGLTTIIMEQSLAIYVNVLMY